MGNENGGPRGPHRFDGQVALVTGASKGIGHGIAAELVAGGASVVMVARGAEALEAARQELASRCGTDQRVHAVTADMSDPNEIAAAFDRLDELEGVVDIAVANCGVGYVRPMVEVPLEEWQAIVDLNLTGTFVTCQLAARRMLAADDRPNRNILVVSSVRALGARAGRSPYAATKAGVNQFVRVIALELAEHGIRVNLLSPGITATPLALEQNPEVFAEVAAEVPLGGAASPADLGRAAAYLCSPAAAHVTGANLVVDGGEALT